LGVDEENFYDIYSYDENDYEFVEGDKRVNKLVASEEWDSIYRIILNRNADFEQRCYALDALIKSGSYDLLCQIARNSKVERDFRQSSIDALEEAMQLDLIAEIITNKPRSSAVNYYATNSIRNIVQNTNVAPENRLKGISVFVHAKYIDVLVEICKDKSLVFRIRAEAVQGLRELGAKSELASLVNHVDLQLSKIIENALRDI
jgi:hypothetical protein